MSSWVLSAVAEKAPVPRTAEYFADAKGRADFAAFDKIMRRKGAEKPRIGEEIAG